MARGVNHRRVALYAFFAIVFLFLIIYAHGRTWSFLFLSDPVSEGGDSETVLSPAVKGAHTQGHTLQASVVHEQVPTMIEPTTDDVLTSKASTATPTGTLNEPALHPTVLEDNTTSSLSPLDYTDLFDPTRDVFFGQAVLILF